MPWRQSRMRMVFDGKHKLVVRTGRASGLYDVEMDLWEDSDVAGREPAVVARLQTVLAENAASR